MLEAQEQLFVTTISGIEILWWSLNVQAWLSTLQKMLCKNSGSLSFSSYHIVMYLYYPDPTRDRQPLTVHSPTTPVGMHPTVRLPGGHGERALLLCGQLCLVPLTSLKRKPWLWRGVFMICSMYADPYGCITWRKQKWWCALGVFRTRTAGAAKMLKSLKMSVHCSSATAEGLAQDTKNFEKNQTV